MTQFLREDIRRDTLYYFADDFLAAGAICALAERGLQAPRDLRLVTHANVGLGPIYPRALTRFAVDPARYGELCAEYMLRYLVGKPVSGRVALPVEYVRGETF